MATSYIDYDCYASNPPRLASGVSILFAATCRRLKRLLMRRPVAALNECAIRQDRNVAVFRGVEFSILGHDLRVSHWPFSGRNASPARCSTMMKEVRPSNMGASIRQPWPVLSFWSTPPLPPWRVAVRVLFVRDGLISLNTQSNRDVDDRQSIAKSVFGLSEAQMLLARRILKGDNLTTASETPSINIDSQTSLGRILYDC